MYKRNVREAVEINRIKTLNEIDKKFKIPNGGHGDYVTTKSWKISSIPENRKRLNCNIALKFRISLKTYFPELSQNMTTC